MGPASGAFPGAANGVGGGGSKDAVLHRALGGFVPNGDVYAVKGHTLDQALWELGGAGVGLGVLRGAGVSAAPTKDR